MHISHKAVDPPGVSLCPLARSSRLIQLFQECKSDMEIFIDYATRMDFRDKCVPTVFAIQKVCADYSYRDGGLLVRMCRNTHCKTVADI